MPARPTTIDEYLAPLSADQRARLEKLRRVIQSAAPKAEECISYGLPAFRHDGRPLVAFGSAAKHYALYPMSSRTLEAHRSDLTGLDTSKGTIRFPLDRPLPVALVRKLVKARIAENQARYGNGSKSSRKTPGKARRKAPRTAKAKEAGPDTGVVEEFLRKLDHPLKKEIVAVREIILGLNPAIREEIKWNAPSFFTTEHFATFNLRAGDRVQLILHQGAKVKDNATKPSIPDPAGLLKWLSTNRALLTIPDAENRAVSRKALAALIRAWIKEM